MAENAINQFSLLENSQKLSILQLSKSISGSQDSSTLTARTSDASVSDDTTTTPATLAADLIHYKVCLIVETHLHLF